MSSGKHMMKDCLMMKNGQVMFVKCIQSRRPGSTNHTPIPQYTAGHRTFKQWSDNYIPINMKTQTEICRILIVDDDNDLCNVMKGILYKKCPVHIAHTLDEAEGSVTRIDPVILFLDNNLPDGLGLDHIRSIKELCPHVAIVLMTAGTAPNLMQLALSNGATQFMSKPFTANLLREVVYTICPELRA